MNQKDTQPLFPLEKLLMALDKSMEGVALLNEKGEYYYLNEEHVVMFGYEHADELIGKTWQHIYGPSEILRINNEIFPLLIKNGHWRGETIGKSKTGTPVLQEISLSFTEDGGIICIARNNADQLSRKNLLQNQEFLLNHSSVLFAILDRHKNFIWANEEFKKMTGLSIEASSINNGSLPFLNDPTFFPDNNEESENETERPFHDTAGRSYSIVWRISYHPQSEHYFLIGRDNTKEKKQAELQEITSLISEGYLHQKNRNEYFNQVLAELLKFTESEYGFMGEVFYENSLPYLKTYALTNIAWSDETRSFYEKHAPAGLEFKNLDTLFGYAMKHRTVVIANNAPQDHRRGGIPSGHPPLNAFLGIPIYTGNDQMVGMIGLANKKTGYSDEDVKLLSPFIDLFGSIINGYKEENLRRETEHALNETLSERNAMFRALDTGNLICITDTEGKIQYANSSFLEALGFESHEMIGKTYKLLNSGEHDESFWADMWTTLKSGKTWRAELCNQSKSGALVWMDMVITPIYNDQAEIKQFMSVSNLVTQRKKLEADIIQQYNQLEEKQRQLQLQEEILKNTNSAVIVTDVNGRITWVNKAFTQITGYDKEEVAGQKPGRFLQFEKTNKETISAFAVALKEKKDYYAEILNRRKNGNEYWIEIKCQPLYNEKGDHTGFFAIEEDITERKEAEEALARAKDLAEASVRAKRMFLANMSHEIRTPLHAIMGISDQLIGLKLTPAQNEKVQMISDSATSLLGIINDVIELSRIEEGRFKIQSVPFYYRHLVKNAFLLFKSTAENKGLKYELEIDPALNHLMMGDPTRIRQVLLNLLSNAVKFTEQGKVKLSCSLKVKDEQEYISIVCSDTGIGMNDDMKKRLFVDFSQEDESFQRKYGGSGLGLAITNELIKLMKGTIGVESEKNKGTTVTVSLPYQEAVETLPAIPDKQEVDPSLLKGKRILVAEDNQFNRLLLEMIFQKHHFSYTMVVNGLEAVERTESEDFDIILMDIQMPEMDGIEAMKKIREQNKNLKILAVTANAIKEELDDYLNKGFDDYLTKPFDETQLLNKMNEVIRQKADGHP